MSALTDSFSLADFQSSAIVPRKENAAAAAATTGDSLSGLRADDLFHFVDDGDPVRLPGAAAFARVMQALTSRASERSAAEAAEEELVNSLTHGIGLAASVAGVAYLLSAAASSENALRFASCAIYGVALVLMFAASTALHAARQGSLKRRFQLYDHIAIYLLIAGTYTPFLAGLMPGALGYSLLAAVWVLAAAGIGIKIKHAERLKETSCLPCLALGWLAVIALPALSDVLRWEGMRLLLAGGISYSIGVLFFCRDDLPYFHAIWHVFVLIGTALHFCVVLNYVGLAL